MIFLNLELNIHFGLSTSHIINFQFLTFSEIQFWSQVFFFFGPWFEREERKWSDSSKKTGDFSVNGFFFMKKVYTRCFFPLNLHEMIYLNPKMFLVTGWLWVLKLIFGLLEVMICFTRCLEFFLCCFSGWKWVFLDLKQTSPISSYWRLLKSRQCKQFFQSIKGWTTCRPLFKKLFLTIRHMCVGYSRPACLSLIFFSNFITKYLVDY
jgi:hypothetical protein